VLVSGKHFRPAWNTLPWETLLALQKYLWIKKNVVKPSFLAEYVILVILIIFSVNFTILLRTQKNLRVKKYFLFWCYHHFSGIHGEILDKLLWANPKWETFVEMHLFNDAVHSNQFLFISKRDRLKWSGE
jgi:hypothetical protein